MAKVKWNYAVVRSVFGDLWIGKTRLEANEQYIFSNIEDASNFAVQLFEDDNPDFDASLEEDDENYDDELLCTFEDLANPIEEEIEEICMERFIVKG
jgi:hypothetical protein